VPDKHKTPGHICTVENLDFKEFRYSEKIPYCKRNVSQEKKVKIYESYSIPNNERKDYTIDHLIPLAIGGSNSEKNLWPENKKIKERRPNLEWDIYKKLEAGDINQEEAITIIIKEKFTINFVQ
jgi:hypothetical protein